MSRAVDREWVLSIVREYEGPLTLYATRLLSDVQRGQDVVQDTFLKLWQADRKHVDGHVRQWLYTVCRNRALDIRRKERRMKMLEAQESITDSNRDVAGRIGPGGTDDEPVCSVLAAVGALPERQQEAVRLKFQGGLSYREIADVMDTTVSNVGVLLHTAIKSIREKLPSGETAAKVRESS